MNNKYPLLIVDELKKNGLIYPKKVIEDGIENYKKRLKKSGERISGEITSRENHFTVDTEVIPNEKGEVLYWDDFAIEGNSVYAVLSEQSYELLKEDFPNEDWSFLLRAHYKLNTRQENDKIIQEITELNVLAIDKYADENEIILN